MHFLIRNRFPVFHGRTAHKLFEASGKIGVISVSHMAGYQSHGQSGGGQKHFGGFHLFADDILLQSVARILFKKNTGYTLKEYIVSEKMESAKMLLSTTTLPVTLISSHVGYGNYSNFTRSFKQLVGCTPMEYRKSVSNQKMQ